MKLFDTKEAKALLDAGKAIAVDVRHAGEYTEGHIAGAVWLENEKITAETAAAALPDKTQKYLIYCHSGMRAEQAKKKLHDLGYTDVENFGGVINWPYGLTK